MKMFVEAYKDITADDQSQERSSESEILTRTIVSMEASDSDPNNLMLRIKTLHFVRDVWTYFLNDLASDENVTPNELKASLFSIGIFILKHLEKMRADKSSNFDPLIEISKIIRKGLDQ